MIRAQLPRLGKFQLNAAVLGASLDKTEDLFQGLAMTRLRFCIELCKTGVPCNGR
jgi:hypothetical protein